MSVTYRSYNPEQRVLFPSLMSDSLPENHLVFFVLDVLSKLDLSAIHSAYESRKGGQPPYHPAMMTGLLLYGYCVGVSSSRKLEKATWEQIPFRVLTADQHPDHDSIAAFRSRHLPALAELFFQVFELCRHAGLVSFGHVALDGTKIEANASKHKAMSYGRMEKKAEELRREISELLRRAEATDAEEDALYGKGVRGDELPAELSRREQRLAKIESAMRDLEAEAREKSKRDDSDDGASGSPPPRPADKAQRNFTDPESRIMQDGSTKEFIYAYNAQAVVDSQFQVIVAADVTQSSNDFSSAIPLLTQAVEIAGTEGIEKASMDAGYGSEANIEGLESMGLDVYAAVKRHKHGVEEAEPVCEVPADAGPRERMRCKLSSAGGKAVYKMRKAIVEPVFGQVKDGRGFRRFSMRGFANARHEWSFVCAVHNLMKLFRHGGSQRRKVAVQLQNVVKQAIEPALTDIFIPVFRHLRLVA